MPGPRTEPTVEPSVKFCYQCGRRTDGTKENCWYCGTYLYREVRPSRKCPFCGSKIPHDAIKCRHCGEFIDGRQREAPATPPPQIIYVVDRSVLGARGDYQLLPGQPVPDEIARRLSAPTVRGIEQNRPELIDQPGVRMLEAPARDVVEIEAESRDAKGRRLLPGAGPRDLIRPGTRSDAALPVPRQETPQRAHGGMLAKLGNWLIRTAPGRSKPVEEIPEAKIEDRYRVCENCQAEILTTDNYCYHCGFQYHKTQSDAARARRGGPNIAGIYALIIVLIGGIYWLGNYPNQLPGAARPGIAAGAIILAIGCFFAKRTFLNQIASIVLMISALLFFLITFL